MNELKKSLIFVAVVLLITGGITFYSLNKYTYSLEDNFASSPISTYANATSSDFENICDNISSDFYSVRVSQFMLEKYEYKTGEKINIYFNAVPLPNESVSVSLVSGTVGVYSENSKETYVYPVSFDSNSEGHFVINSKSMSGNMKIRYLNFTMVSNDCEEINVTYKAVLEENNNFKMISTYNNEESSIEYYSSMEKENKNNNKVYKNEDNSNDISDEEEETREFDKTVRQIVISGIKQKTISSKVFEDIRESKGILTINSGKNEIIFYGEDITSPKNLNTFLEIYPVKDENAGKNVRNGYVIEFADNGILPGKALIRIKATEEMKVNFSNKSLFLYYFNELKNNYQLEADNIMITSDEFYEFYLTHNSKFILTSDEVKENISVIGNDEEDNLNNEVTSKDKILVFGSLTIVFVSAGIMFYFRYKNKKEKNINIKKNEVK